MTDKPIHEMTEEELNAELPDGITTEDCGDLGTLDAVLQGDYP